MPPNDELSSQTSIFGLRLWVVLGVCVGATIVLISIWLAFKRSSKPKTSVPDVSKEIQEIRLVVHDNHNHQHPPPIPPDPVPSNEQLPLPEEETLRSGRTTEFSSKMETIIGFREVNLVDWLKKMVSDRNPEGVLDPKLPEKPTSRALKRALLVALRCTGPNAQKRPKMGHVVHMLEAEDSPYKEDRRVRRDAGQSPNTRLDDRLKEEATVDDGKLENQKSGNETKAQTIK